MTVYGYARVSTQKQSIERQIANIYRAHPETKEIWMEKATGTRIDVRKEFCKLIGELQAGDTLVLDSVSRFSRQADAGFKLYEELFDRGVNLVFLKEPYINTDNYRAALQGVDSIPDATDSNLKPLFNGLKKTLMLLAKQQFYQAFEQSEKEVKDLSQRTKEGMQAKGAGEKISKALKGKTYETERGEYVKGTIKKCAKAFGGNMKDGELINLLKCGRNTYYKYKRELTQEEEK
jgi:DNA invertase Pin-like site-specific DNA recombinase